MESRWNIQNDLGPGPCPETMMAPVDGAEMVLIPEGPFTMGISEEEFIQLTVLDQRLNPVFASEIPAANITLDAYYIDRYPVTNYQYFKFTEETGHRKPMLWIEPTWNKPMQPVVFVNDPYHVALA